MLPRDDIWKLPMSASSKRFARRKGLKTLTNTRLWDRMVADVVNQGDERLSIKTGGKLLRAEAAKLVRAALGDLDREFRHTPFSAEKAAFKGYDVVDFAEYPIERLSVAHAYCDFENGPTVLNVLNFYTRPSHTRQGRATFLAKKLVELAAKLGKKIDWGTFTAEGQLYLRPVAARLAPSTAYLNFE